MMHAAVSQVPSIGGQSEASQQANAQTPSQQTPEQLVMQLPLTQVEHASHGGSQGISAPALARSSRVVSAAPPMTPPNSPLSAVRREVPRANARVRASNR
jgi:hypothetical protein